MGLLMARIDDRLIHGQVVIGCCEPLDAKIILVCDADVAADSLRRGLFSAAVPPEVNAEFHDEPETVARLAELGREGKLEKTLLLTASCAAMRSLVATEVDVVEAVTVGGLHAHPGATESAGGFFLNDQDREDLLWIESAGIEVLLQPVPAAPCLSLDEVVGNSGGDS